MFLCEKNVSERKKCGWVLRACAVESLQTAFQAFQVQLCRRVHQIWKPISRIQNTEYRKQKVENRKKETGNGKQVRLSKCNSAAAWSPDRSRSATWLLVIETQGLMGIRHIRQ